MSLYKRLHTPNSPLLPLSPMPMASPSMFLSPYTTSIRSRRSFTPSHLNMLPPPSVSPIQATILSAKNKQRKPAMQTTPDQMLECSLVMSSVKKSMKKVRSTARITRKIEARNNRLVVPLTPIRRSLFREVSPSPHIEIETPKASHNGSHIFTPNWLTPKAFGTPAGQVVSPQLMHNDFTPSTLLEETFTVMSILKEINMEKYATLFAREEVDLLVFLMLTRNDMIELGIDEADHIILLNAIRCYTEFFGNPEKMFI
ncbi:uncharacterized protein LOC129578603 [Sitodiplosis mosellana]|uniref:uncharacterized protein LOC129578603 n=1 Tax=Sitodiplosis mosellana TaxID=263140 RepID=UPI00244513C3|nr:uncharacterized protein LOC129578603 [Sitodiplosis mosellana]